MINIHVTLQKLEVHAWWNYLTKCFKNSPAFKIGKQKTDLPSSPFLDDTLFSSNQCPCPCRHLLEGKNKEIPTKKLNCSGIPKIWQFWSIYIVISLSKKTSYFWMLRNICNVCWNLLSNNLEKKGIWLDRP